MKLITCILALDDAGLSVGAGERQGEKFIGCGTGNPGTWPHKFAPLPVFSEKHSLLDSRRARPRLGVV